MLVAKGSYAFDTADLENSVVVKRTVGFGTGFAFIAEATTLTASGEVATVREFGHTAEGATTRARLAAAAKLTAKHLATRFHADGFRDDSRNGATFAVGFA